MDDRPPVVLKRDDAPEPRDPWLVGRELTELLNAIKDGSAHLLSQYERFGSDPIGVTKMAKSRAAEIHELATAARQLGEELMRGKRRQGEFSASFSPDQRGR